MPRYARNGDVSLAYDVIGEGERDILVTGRRRERACRGTRDL
jgi:hypothetical protein